MAGMAVLLNQASNLRVRIRRLESNYLIFRLGWPGMEAAKVMRVIELMGERVLPHFHAKYGRG